MALLTKNLISDSLQILLYFRLWSCAYELSKADTKKAIKPALSIFPGSGMKNGHIFDLLIESLLILILISLLEYVCILLKYFLATVLTHFAYFCRLQFTWFHALVVFVIELKVDFHSLLPLRRVDSFDL